MKVAILTTVWGRAVLTTIHFHWMRKLIDWGKPLDLEFRPHYILNPDDPEFGLFYRMLDRLDLHYHVVPQQTLSNKTQAGLWHILKGPDFDYLMHLDSDEFLSDALLSVWRVNMMAGNPWFGTPGSLFHDTHNKATIRFPGYKQVPVVNGGHCISRKVLKEVNDFLWMPGLNKGLNRHEHLRLKGTGRKCNKIKFPLDSGVLELKSGFDIHPLSWFEDRHYELRCLDPKEVDYVREQYYLLDDLVDL